MVSAGAPPRAPRLKADRVRVRVRMQTRERMRFDSRAPQNCPRTSTTATSPTLDRGQPPSHSAYAPT